MLGMMYNVIKLMKEWDWSTAIQRYKGLGSECKSNCKGNGSNEPYAVALVCKKTGRN
jgi:hypothetical protein